MNRRPGRDEVDRAMWRVRDVRDPTLRRFAHLVDLDGAARAGGSRYPLCRTAATTRWARLDLVAARGDGTPPLCPDCEDLQRHPPAAPDPPPAWPAPPPVRRDRPVRPAPVPSSAAAARTERRAAFRAAFADTAPHYQPVPDRRPPSWQRPPTDP